jgi:hypothetical protein
MYLTQLRASDVSHTNWPSDGNAELLDICFNIVDDTLNSWVEAHTAFKRRQRFHHYEYIGTHIHQTFTRLVVDAMKHIEDDEVRSYGSNKFPSETLAYALLRVWLAREAEEMKLQKVSNI